MTLLWNKENKLLLNKWSQNKNSPCHKKCRKLLRIRIYLACPSKILLFPLQSITNRYFLIFKQYFSLFGVQIIRLSKEYNNSFYSYGEIYKHLMNIYAMKCKCEESFVVSMVECIFIWYIPVLKRCLRSYSGGFEKCSAVKFPVIVVAIFAKL